MSLWQNGGRHERGDMERRVVVRITACKGKDGAGGTSMDVVERPAGSCRSFVVIFGE